MSERLREEDVTRKAQLKDFAEFMKHVLPETPVQKFETRNRITTPPSVPVKRWIVESLPLTSAAVEIETPRKRNFEINDEE